MWSPNPEIVNRSSQWTGWRKAALALLATAGFIGLGATALPAQSNSAPAHPAVSSSQTNPQDLSAMPLAIAHGAGASVEPQKGAYLHHWIGADGQPFEILNRVQQEPTLQERQMIEKKFNAWSGPQANEKIDKSAPSDALMRAEQARKDAAGRASANSPNFQPQKEEELDHSMKLANRAREIALRLAQAQASK